jgi:hypothetical protein
MVTNEKHPDFGKVFRCAGLGPENLILSADQRLAFHYLNITKVIPCECTYEVKSGDAVCSFYAIRYPHGAIRNLVFGKILADSDEYNWSICVGKSTEVEVPKAFTFRIIRELSLKHYENGVRGIIASGISESWVG